MYSKNLYFMISRKKKKSDVQHKQPHESKSSSQYNNIAQYRQESSEVLITSAASQWKSYIKTFLVNQI